MSADQPARDGSEQDVETLAAEHGHWCSSAFTDADDNGITHFTCECGLPWSQGVGCAFVRGLRAMAAQKRQAGAAALREAADEVAWKRPEVSPCAPNFEECCGSEECCDAMRPVVSVVGADWLRARAERLEASE